MLSAGRESFLIQLPSVDDSSSGPGFELGISASPYSGTLTIFDGKFGLSGAAGALVAGRETSKTRASVVPGHLIITTPLEIVWLRRVCSGFQPSPPTEPPRSIIASRDGMLAS